MKPEKNNLRSNTKPYGFRYLFLPCLCLLYGILWLVAPERALLAVENSARILGLLLLPLGMVFLLMVFLNLFLKSSRVVRFLGAETGPKGVLLSAAAGIISFGPIYAWYPLLKEMRNRGAGPKTLAVFLGNRAVKPFLLPVMISYFGWIYVFFLTFFMMLGAVAVGYLVDAFCRGDRGSWHGAQGQGSGAHPRDSARPPQEGRRNHTSDEYADKIG